MRLFPLLLLAVALALPAGAADAAPKRTGVYVGVAEHPPFSFAPDLEPYETNFVVRVNNGRVTGIYVEVRLECPDVAIQDVRYSRLVMKKGPKLRARGGFTLKKKGIVVSGAIGKKAAAGTITARKGECSIDGVSWDAKKRRF